MTSPPGPTTGSKQALFEQLAVIARALGRGARLELLDFLVQGERSVDDLTRVTGLSIANTSKHLQQLKAAGLAQARRDGKHVRYGLADDAVLDAVAALRVLAERRSPALEELSRAISGIATTWSRCRRRFCWSGCAMDWRQ
jgi:DNA-binding transcriptional ArsR family regulator